MTNHKTQILNDIQFKQIIKRVAFQVYENNFNEKELIIGGINGNGFVVAQMLHEQLSAICKLKLSLIKIYIDKEEPSEKNLKLSDEKLPLKGKNVLLVDDVLNTGRTMIYALLPFVKAHAKQIHTMVLVDRDHKSFPVSADFIGISLSTTLQEHVMVTIEKKKVNVFLS
jgi:pyrimidine operon attenuation protein / uracil phosphoribosyltransferase